MALRSFKLLGRRGFEGLKGVFSLIYKKYRDQIKEEYADLLQKFFGILDEIQKFQLDQNGGQVPAEGEQDPFMKGVEDVVVDIMVQFLKADLKDLLNILLIRKPEFPLPRGISQCLHKVILEKTLLTRMFNYLTDILNNPEQSKPLIFRIKAAKNALELIFLIFLPPQLLT